MQHRDLPMHELVRSLGGRIAPGSLFSSLFTLIDAAQPGTYLGGSLRQRQSLDYGGAAFDCSCFFLAHSESPELAIEYNSALYAAGDIEKSLEHYYRILLQCLESCEQRQARDWRRLRLVDDADYRAAEHLRRQSGAQSADGECLHQAFGRMQERDPGRIAVVWSDGVDRLQLSYRQLSRQADAVARFLATLEPAADAPVALVARWHPASVAAMLGILRAGCAYLPVDPDYPPARIAYMLRDSGCGIVLSAADLELPAGLSVRCFSLDTAIAFTTEQGDTAGANYRRDNPGGLAYVIYTSGSSGPPKGVMVEHRAAVYSTRERSRVYAEWRPQRFLLQSSIAFDSAVAGLWWTLSTGGTLYLTTPSLARAADQLVALIQQESITHTLCLPSQWRDICRLAPTLGTLRLVIVAGEACDSKVARAHFKAAPQAALFNEYGPTEMTVWSTWQRLLAEQADPVPIGKPLSQTQALILDRWGNLVPDGLAGELCLAGAGIARGYLGSGSAATESGFIDHPLDPASRAYRTGDRVRRDSRDRLYFEGRVDEQVKFRGHRIAIESVEATLRRAGSTALAVLPFNGESLEALLEQLPEAEALAMLARHGATSTG
jgi:amino acid adenylation domain-containing protein